MAQKGCLGRNAFFLLFHFCIEKRSYATSGAGTASHSGAPESTPELRFPSLAIFTFSVNVIFLFTQPV
jgi:hypothetical protein